MEYSAVICISENPSPWPLFLGLGPSRAPGPAAHRPLRRLRHILILQDEQLAIRDGT